MQFIRVLLNVLIAIVLVDALSSWFVAPDEFPRSLFAPFLTPIYTPIRAVVGPKTLGGIDVSAIVIVIAAQVVQHFLKPKTLHQGD